MLYGQGPLMPQDQAFQFRCSPYVLTDDYNFVEQIQLRLSAAWETVTQRIQRAQAAQKVQHDKKVTSVELKTGDIVLLRRMVSDGRAMKLGPRYSEPFEIQKVHNAILHVVPVGLPTAVPLRVHARNVKLYKSGIDPRHARRFRRHL